MTKNNQKTYERPTLQVLFVETESVMAAGSPITAAGSQIDVMATSTRYNSQGLQDIDDVQDQSDDWR